MKRIREIIRKMEQGYTEAILCRTDDDVRYVVKTRLSGMDTLVKEWLCYRIGSRLGLPIPAAEFVYMDTRSGSLSVFPEAAALAECPGFGSELIEPTDILTTDEIPAVASETRARVLLFDCWIMNRDRTDANPNLLWLQHGGKLNVIDHNLTFGDEDTVNIRHTHLFRGDATSMTSLRPQMLPIMMSIIGELPDYWSELPDEWKERCIIRRERVDEILRRCLNDSFWKVP